MELELSQMLILFACVFLGGLVDSIAGGGGLITLPAYYAVGIPAHMALGTNKFANSIGTLTALLRFLKEGQINIKVALVAALGALVGSPLGAQLAMALDEKYLNYILLVAVPVTEGAASLTHQDTARLLPAGEAAVREVLAHEVLHTSYKARPKY